MKRFLLSMFSVVLLFAFSACRDVVVTSADELTSKVWCAKTSSGIEAQLVFSENTAMLSICGEDEVLLSGHLAIDSQRFYITNSEDFRTYTFTYKVYTDRAVISHNGNELVFYPSEITKTSDES